MVISNDIGLRANKDLSLDGLTFPPQHLRSPRWDIWRRPNIYIDIPISLFRYHNGIFNFLFSNIRSANTMSSNAYKAYKGSRFNNHVRFLSWVGLVEVLSLPSIKSKWLISMLSCENPVNQICAQGWQGSIIYMSVVTMGRVKSPRATVRFINLLLAGIMDKISTSLWRLSFDHAQFVKSNKDVNLSNSLASVLWEDSDIGVWVILKYHWNLDTCHHQF